jgi:hypothetical protein
MARVLNLLIVILELIPLTRNIKNRKFKKGMVYYTRISNFLTLWSSLFLVILGQRYCVGVFRYLTVTMLTHTFFVTTFVLVPMTGDARKLLFSGSGLYHHLVIPVLSFISYVFVEEGVPFVWIWLPVVLTLVYGFTMLYLNKIEKVDGPYPFFRIRVQGTVRTILWMIALACAACAFAAGVAGLKLLMNGIVG